MIEGQDFSDSRFHTIYALSLAKSTIEAFEEETNSQNPGTGKMEGRTTSDPATNLIFQIPVRERLQIFLQSSDLYDAEEILDLIEGSELWWEKVSHNSLITLFGALVFFLFFYLFLYF